MTGKGKYLTFLLTFLFLFIFIGKFNFVQAADYGDMGTKTNIDPNKAWTLEFNKKLDKSTVNSSNITILDGSEQQVPINISLGNDESSIVVSPEAPYNYGKTYSLIINTGLKALNGNVLSKATKLQFTIEDNSSSTSINKQYTVCIDPGHGGSDSGNISTSGIKEKDVDLSVALKLGKILQDNGVNVVYTRQSDNVTWNSSNDLQARFDVSNNAKADFFISIHSNSYPEDASVNGIETYYRASDDIAKQLAQSVQDELIKNTGSNDRGIKTGLPQHEILRGTIASAIMVELGFMTNAQDSAAMETDSFQNSSASAIANGILKSLSLINKSNNISISSIADMSDQVVQNNSYILPPSVQATMSDGSYKQVSVIWNTQTVDTSQVGTYKYQGQVPGYSSPINFTLSVISTPDTSSNNTICIDPGHGLGDDIGATGIGGLKEDDVTLPVGLYLGKILQAHGVNVVYTRTTDMSSTPMSVVDSLQRRCDISNNANARYFISIHNNSADDPSASGTETWDNPGDSDSVKLATAIQNNIVQQLGTYDRGLKDGYGRGLYVIKNTNAPAVLVELGFLTNPDDYQKLKDDAYQQKFAQAMADAILQVLGIQ